SCAKLHGCLYSRSNPALFSVGLIITCRSSLDRSSNHRTKRRGMCRADPIGYFDRCTGKLFINSLFSPPLYTLPGIAPSDADDLGFARDAGEKVRIIPFIGVWVRCNDTRVPTGF